MSTNCRVSLVGAVEVSLCHSAGQLASEDAGSNGLDEDLLLWQRHFAILMTYVHHVLLILSEAHQTKLLIKKSSTDTCTCMHSGHEPFLIFGIYTLLINHIFMHIPGSAIYVPVLFLYLHK